jgi:hypothetical protein
LAKEIIPDNDTGRHHDDRPSNADEERRATHSWLIELAEIPVFLAVGAAIVRDLVAIVAFLAPIDFAVATQAIGRAATIGASKRSRTTEPRLAALFSRVNFIVAAVTDA